MDGACSSDVQKAVADSIVHAKLSQPSATPDPMREKRICPRSEGCCGEANRSQPPPVCPAAQRNQHGQAHAKNLKQSSKRGHRTFTGEFSKEERLGGHPIPAFSGNRENVTCSAD